MMETQANIHTILKDVGVSVAAYCLAAFTVSVGVPSIVCLPSIVCCAKIITNRNLLVAFSPLLVRFVPFSKGVCLIPFMITKYDYDCTVLCSLWVTRKKNHLLFPNALPIFFLQAEQKAFDKLS